jgi:hypothetical protein
MIYLALPLFFIGMMSTLTFAIVEIQLTGRWGFLWIWFGGCALLAFALWPIRKRIVETVKDTF